MHHANKAIIYSSFFATLAAKEASPASKRTEQAANPPMMVTMEDKLSAHVRFVSVSTTCAGQIQVDDDGGNAEGAPGVRVARGGRERGVLIERLVRVGVDGVLVRFGGRAAEWHAGLGDDFEVVLVRHVRLVGHEADVLPPLVQLYGGGG